VAVVLGVSEHGLDRAAAGRASGFGSDHQSPAAASPAGLPADQEWIRKRNARRVIWSGIGHTVLNASVGESQAARIAGISPAMAPIRIAEATPTAHASVGITTAQCLVWV